VVYRIKIFTDVEFYKIAASFALLKGIEDCRVGSFAFTTGITVSNKQAFKYRFEYVHQRVMHYPLVKGGGAYFTQFRVGDYK
jgi:hypothetical protein